MFYFILFYLFVARGRGYLHAYSNEDAAKALSAEDKGRPLLRLGYLDAARSRGGAVSCILNGNPAALLNADSRSDAVTVAAGGDCVDEHACSLPSCRKKRKDGCLWKLCKRCCGNMQELDVRGDSYPHAAALLNILNSHEDRTSRSGTTRQCPVHKFKQVATAFPHSRLC
jgi:hypothetical protein